jgi:hypothetical protein
MEARPTGRYAVSKAVPLGGADSILTSTCDGKKEPQPRANVAKLRQVEALRLSGKTCAEAVRSIGVSEVTYRRWRAEFGGLIWTLGPNHAPVK